MNYFLLAFLLGIVLRYVARAGTQKLVYVTMDDKELKKRKMFKVYVISYIVGSIMAGFGFALSVAYTIKEHLL